MKYSRKSLIYSFTHVQGISRTFMGSRNRTRLHTGRTLLDDALYDHHINQYGKWYKSDKQINSYKKKFNYTLKIKVLYDTKYLTDYYLYLTISKTSICVSC